MRGVLRGILAIVVGVMCFTSPASALVGGETVVTARVMPVRHIVVDEHGVILRIVSNTPEDVTPVVHLGNFEGPEVALTDEVKNHYDHLVAGLNMQRPADYVRKSDLEITVAQLGRIASLPLQTISRIQLRP